ncbi:TIGR03086 family protein [Streptomyces sp. TRM66268-LWL]|uniref:TIGR03086 family protein n=1 Tax=Streptomyces polyasparticus TaxID=2767826 RepID=A0ABR7SJ81_9ACTN|nr:TIGR03086 family metal-binding protein [Streptomyces polyasparticus]MBC9714909.1 TIGR03086 family protein [Streptomyces polyasparticus]
MNQQNQQISELMTVAGERASAVLDGIEDGQLGAPTPCAEYDVRALANHLLHVVVQFQALAAKQIPDFSTTPDYIGEDPEWRKRFAAEVHRLAQAWAAPGALEGVTGMMDMPAPTVARMALGDLVVHAWDLAEATGQTYAPDPAVVADVAPAFAELAPGGRQMGVFGDPVDVPENASPLDRLLALTGRDPQWTCA